MAFRRKTVVVSPERDLRLPSITKPIGVVLPFNNPNGVFTQSFTNRAQVYSNLRNLLLTAKGERFFEPDFGTDIRSVLFENITDEEDFTERLKGEISAAIERWLPYLIIQTILVDLNVGEDGRVDDPSHVVGIFIKVLISGTNIYLPVRLFISDNASIRIEEESNN